MSWFVNSSSIKINCKSCTEAMWGGAKVKSMGFGVRGTWIQTQIPPFLPEHLIIPTSQDGCEGWGDNLINVGSAVIIKVVACSFFSS